MALREQAGLESAVPLTPSAKHPAWMYSGGDHYLEPLLQMREPTPPAMTPAYVLNGALYLASRAFLLREQAFISPDTVGYVMPAERSVDVDTQLDWQWAEFLMMQQT